MVLGVFRPAAFYESDVWTFRGPEVRLTFQSMSEATKDGIVAQFILLNTYHANILHANNVSYCLIK